jgi:phage shock protein PspC (stress-responsive transcriptional regulator)
MKKTINVNLNRRVFTMDEDAYQLLDNYLSNLRNYFRREEGAAEIVADFEARIEELFSEKIRLGYQVIILSNVEEVIARVGKPDDFSEEKTVEEEKHTTTPESQETRKKFFLDPDDKIIGGVCSGISAYFGWNVLAIRIIFIIAIVLTSLWIVPVYLLFWMICPTARTAEQKLQMQGKPITVENIGKTVAAEREKPQERSGCLGSFIESIGGFLKVCFIGLGCLIGFPILFAIIIVIVVLFAVLFGVGGGILGALPMALYGESAILTVSNPILATTTFIILLIIPLVALIYGIAAYFAKLKPLNIAVKWVSFSIWIVALILFLCSGFRINREQIGNTQHWHWNWQDAIEGNGILTEKEYRLSPIDYISVEENLFTHLQIEQVPGDSASLLISGDENLIDKIRYETREGRLRLSTHHDIRLNPDNNLIIRVQTPSLRKIRTRSVNNISISNAFVSDKLELELNGAGTFRADSLTVQNLKVDLEGITLVTLAGYARNATFDVEGAGKIDAWDLSADTVDAKVDGVASIRCNPVKYLKGRVSGVGKIKYKNEPENKNTGVVGIGSIGLEQ